MTRASKRPSTSRTSARYYMLIAVALPSHAVRFMFSAGRDDGRKNLITTIGNTDARHIGLAV